MTQGDPIVGRVPARLGGGGPATPSLLRALNDRAALDLLTEHGELSRSQIGRMTGLSKPTASQLLARLETAGLVETTGTVQGRPGRGAVLYRVSPQAGYAAALDVTPARIQTVVADIAGSVIAQHELPTPRGSGDAVENVRSALEGAGAVAGIAPHDLDCIVIGTPGSFDRGTGKLRYAKHLPGWHASTLLDDLGQACGTNVMVENDVNLAALAEYRRGSAMGCADFFLFWAAEGLGGALMLGGQLYRGATGGAGEIGFMQGLGRDVVRQVRRENSGAFQSCAGPEQVLALGRQYRLPGRTAAAVLAAAAAIHSEDGASAAFLDELSRRYAAGLASIIAVVDPAMVVLAGGLMTAGGEPLRARVAQQLRELAMAQPNVVLSTVPGNPVLAGALGASLDAARDTAFATR